MKIAIMQPYFFPYIGYFQLINAVEKFVVYDNLKFTKKGWIHRNRILVNGKDEYISLQLKNDSDYLDIKDRYLADSYEEEKSKFLRRIEGSYNKAPFYKEVFPVIKSCILFKDTNLFNYLANSITELCLFLNIKTEIVASSKVNINHQLKSQEKVIAICNELQATEYINAIGGMELYSKEEFNKHSVILSFIKTKPIEYKQFQNQFVRIIGRTDYIGDSEHRIFFSKGSIMTLRTALLRKRCILALDADKISRRLRVCLHGIKCQNKI